MATLADEFLADFESDEGEGSEEEYDFRPLSKRAVSPPPDKKFFEPAPPTNEAMEDDDDDDEEGVPKSALSAKVRAAARSHKSQRLEGSEYQAETEESIHEYKVQMLKDQEIDEYHKLAKNIQQSVSKFEAERILGKLVKKQDTTDISKNFKRKANFFQVKFYFLKIIVKY